MARVSSAKVEGARWMQVGMAYSKEELKFERDFVGEALEQRLPATYKADEGTIKRVDFYVAEGKPIAWESLAGKLGKDVLTVVIVRNALRVSLPSFLDSDTLRGRVLKDYVGLKSYNKLHSKGRLAGDDTLFVGEWNEGKLDKHALRWRVDGEDKTCVFAAGSVKHNLLVIALGVDVPEEFKKPDLKAWGLDNVLDVVADALPEYSIKGFDAAWYESACEEALVGAATKSIKERKKSLEEEEKKAIADVDTFSSEINQRVKRLSMIGSEITALKQAKNELSDTVRSKLAKVKSFPQVEKVDVVVTGLVVHTKPLVLKHAKFEYPIGRYEIRLNLNKNTITVKNEFQADNEVQHPHARSFSEQELNNVCMGDMASVYRNLAYFDLEVVVRYVLQILQSYNPDSPIDRLGAFCDRLKAKGKIELTHDMAVAARR